MKRKIIYLILLIALIIVTLLLDQFIIFKKNNYFNIDTAMKKAEFIKKTKGIYEKENKGKAIRVEFDFNNNICKKNDYEFSIEDSYIDLFTCKFIKENKLKEIINYQFEYTSPVSITAKEVNYAEEGWTEYPKLIAHAGGAVREEEYAGLYTNSYEALVQNYSLGHRVFEYDFYLTSDKKLACVHDWKQFGDFNGRAYSEEEWLNTKTVGSPVTKSKYTTMTIDTLMDEMLVNPDIFIVTDTKSTQFSREDAKKEFELIYLAAEKKSALELLDRIIPQIYNNEMYDYVTEVYKFPSIIYTTYSTKLTGEEIMTFVEEHKEIKAVTHPEWDDRIDNKRMKAANKIVYIHTMNTLSEMLVNSLKDVDGFYTDLLLPEDYNVFLKYKDKSYKE